MNDRTTEFEPNKALAADGTDASGTVNAGNDTDTSPQAFQHTVSQPATPSALLDFKLLEAGTETVTYPRSFGAYDLLEEVARGGMGVVFKAKQRGLDRTVALKMILGLQEHGTNAARFVEEARAIAALDHPNVVPIFDIGEVAGRMYFTMPFVSGPSLKALVEKGGLPSVPKAVGLFLQITSGMAQAHRQGIMHRDLKPANVLVDGDGRPRVADFGLAKRGDAADRANMTGTGQLMGTPAYMSPEQARDSKDVTPATDVYSLGAILFYLLTGRAPFVGDTIPDLLIQVVSAAPPSPRQLNPAVPEDVEAVCLKCLAKAPADRYPDAVALADALAPLADRYLSRSSLSHVPLSSALLDSVSIAGVTTLPTAPPTPPAPPPERRRPAWLLPALALLLLAGGAAAVLFWPRDGGKPVANNNDPTPKPADAPKPTPADATPPKVTPEPAADDSTWPAPKSDFGLTVELKAKNQTAAAGVVHIPDRTPLEMQLRADVDCWVYVFVVAPDDSATLLFPLSEDGDGRLSAGRTRVVPSATEDGLETSPTAGVGVERVRVLASTKKLPPLPAGAKIGNFRQFAGDVQKADLRRAVREIRDIHRVKRPKGEVTAPTAQFAEAEVKFHVP